MLQPTFRGLGSAAYQLPLRTALQRGRTWHRCQCDLNVAVSKASRLLRVPLQRPSIAPSTPGRVQWFSVSHRKRSKEHGSALPAAANSNNATETSSTTTSTSSPTSSPSPTPAESPSSSTSDVPWYMRVDVPKHASLALLDTPIPPIPTNAPSLVEPLLTFVAEELGLVELKLLDLRALDPPAALGPDLIMLFGSARSERHLHVSADRLVRWLRKYGINATADGLLGRNELKIKLRRKARRAKLLGNMASLESASGGDQIDDGISTQWVCLHAGTVGRSRAEGQTTDADGRTTGFGSLRSTGTTVVVQMFTEAKRKQLGLEMLWSKTLARSVTKRINAGEDLPAWALAAAEAARETIASAQIGEMEAAEEHTEGSVAEDPFRVQPKTSFSAVSSAPSDSSLVMSQ